MSRVSKSWFHCLRLGMSTQKSPLLRFKTHSPSTSKAKLHKVTRQVCVHTSVGVCLDFKDQPEVLNQYVALSWSEINAWWGLRITEIDQHWITETLRVEEISGGHLCQPPAHGKRTALEFYHSTEGLDQSHTTKSPRVETPQCLSSRALNI